MLTQLEKDLVLQRLDAVVGGTVSPRGELIAAMPPRLRSMLPEGLTGKSLFMRAVDICCAAQRVDQPPAICAFLEFILPMEPPIELIVARVKIEPPGATEQDIFEMTLLDSKLPFLGRPTLRGHLKAMARGQGRSVLVVNGQTDSGKTYTTELVDHARRLLPGILSCHIEIFEGQGASIGPGELARDVMTQLGFDAGALPPPNETNRIRWSQELANALIHAANQSGLRCWIVLDGFNQNELRPDTKQLIVNLAHGVASGAAQGHHRLILADFLVANLSAPAGSVAREDVPALSLASVDPFIKMIGARKSDEEIQSLIETVKRDLSDPVVSLSEIGQRLADLVELLG